MTHTPAISFPLTRINPTTDGLWLKNYSFPFPHLLRFSDFHQTISRTLRGWEISSETKYSVSLNPLTPLPVSSPFPACLHGHETDVMKKQAGYLYQPFSAPSWLCGRRPSTSLNRRCERRLAANYLSAFVGYRHPQRWPPPPEKSSLEFCRPSSGTLTSVG